MMSIKTKKQVQVEQQILYNLTQIIEICPQYSVAQHFVHFMRPKSDNTDVYGWSDDIILKKIEEYYDELREDLLTPSVNED